MNCLAHHAVRAAFILLVVASCLLVGAPLANSAPGIQYGVEQNGGMEVPWQRTEILDTQKQLGSTVIRYVLRFDRVAVCDPAKVAGSPAPTSPANKCYNWTVPDLVVRGAQERGMSVILSVYGVPGWEFNSAENWTGGTDAEYAAFVADYADFVQAATTRYDGRHDLPRVPQWTIWNEPNGSFFMPRFDANKQMIGPQRYARMYDTAARRLKAVDPTLEVAVGPTAPMSPSLTPMVFAQTVLPLLQQMGSPIDAWAHNAYMGKQSVYSTTITAPYIGLGNVDQLIALFDSYGVAQGKPVWITEFGYQTPPASQSYVTPQQQEILVGEVLKYAYEHPRITRFMYYSLFDDEVNGTNYGFQSGLYYAASKRCGGKLCPKLAAASFRHTLYISPVAANGTVLLWGQGRLQPASTRIFLRPPGKGWSAYASPDTATTGTVVARLKVAAGTEVVVCDVSCGTIRVYQPTTGGGGQVTASKVTRRVLPAVRLAKRTSLLRGIAYDVNCTDCTVTSTLIAKGRASALPIAYKRAKVVSKGRVRAKTGGKRVLLTFNPSVRRVLLKAKASKLVIHTVVRYGGGSVVVSDRVVVLR